jgi:hypothetical protein
MTDFQSQTYFTTGGLPTVSSSWRQPLEDHDQRFFSLQLNPCCHSHYVTSSMTTGWVCVLWIGFASPLSSVRIAYIACYWEFFLVHYIQVLCQSSLCKAFPRRPSLYSIGTNRTENYAPNSSSMVVAGRCLPMACLFIEPLPRNGQCSSSHITVRPVVSCCRSTNIINYRYNRKILIVIFLLKPLDKCKKLRTPSGMHKLYYRTDCNHSNHVLI